jgi:hypothetical protein
MSLTSDNFQLGHLLTAIISISLAFVITLFLKALSHRHVPDTKLPRKRAPQTWRISNIPGSVTELEFKDALNKFMHASKWSGFSFTGSGHSENLCVATVTFREPFSPDQLQTALKKFLNIESSYLSVDSQFFGLTPLAEPKPATVE